MGTVQSTVSFVGTTSITTISTPTSTTTIPTPTSLSTSTISPISQAPAAAPITAVVTVTTGVDAPGPVSTIVPLETPSGSFLVTSLSISGTAPVETSSGSSSVTSSHISATPTTLLTTTSTTSIASSSSSSYIWPSTPPPYASTALPQTTGSPLYLFTYGDSYTSTGFNITLTPPSISNPLGNPGYPGVTSTGPGEPNWVDIFVTNSPLNTLMYDLAVSGSSVAGANIQGQSRELAHFVNTSTTFAANRPLQPAGRKWNAANSAHLIWFGRNDVYWAVLQNQNTTALMHARIDAVTTSYVTAMQTLFDAGARRFLIMGMPPMWREPEWSLPFAPWTGWAPTIQPAVAYWDATLTRKLKAWKKGKPAVQMSFFDMTPAFSQVLDNTAKWGLRNATCDNLDDPEDAGHCAFSDLVHPGPPLASSIAIAVGRQLVSLGWLKAFALSYTI